MTVNLVQLYNEGISFPLHNVDDKHEKNKYGNPERGFVNIVRLILLFNGLILLITMTFLILYLLFLLFSVCCMTPQTAFMLSN